MTDNTESPSYTVTSQVHGVEFNDANQAVNGWTITVRDNLTAVTVPVFVPDDRYTPENARLAIAAKLAVVRAIHSLGE